MLNFGEISLWGFTFNATLHTYGVLLAIGFLMGLKLASARGKKIGVEPGLIMDLGLYILVSALVGAKLLLLIVDWQHYSHEPLALLRSGGVFYGGLITATLTAIWFSRKHRLSIWQMADIFAPPIALGHAIGRIGCLSAGCCYGKPTTAPWGITFTNPYSNEVVGVPLGMSLHPTQLYEAGVELSILLFLLWLSGRKRFDGHIFCAYVILYSTSRIVIEFFRGDPRGFVLDGMMSTSQLMSILMLVFTFTTLVVLRWKQPHKTT